MKHYTRPQRFSPRSQQEKRISGSEERRVTMKHHRSGGRLDYCFDSTCANWSIDRFDLLATTLIRSLCSIPEIGFHVVEGRSVAITRLHLLDAADREVIARRADNVYRQVMGSPTDSHSSATASHEK